jgi:hexosaminidase
MLLINRSEFEIHKESAVQPMPIPTPVEGMSESVSDVRLVSIWHGPQTIGTIHFSLYNNGPERLVAFTLCLTGTLWMTDRSKIHGGQVVETLSNFIRVRPDQGELEPGAVWTFSLSGLNSWPRHAGDGPQSAYIAFDDGHLAHVAVQTLARSQHAEELEGAKPDDASVIAAPVASHMTIAVIPFPNVASVSIAPLSGVGPVLAPQPDLSPAHLRLCREVGNLAGRVVPGGHGIFAEPGEVALRRLFVRIVDDARLGPEGYKVLFDDGDVHIDAEAEEGIFYGLTTLAQMVVGARQSARQFGFPVRGTLTDIPRFSWRGVMIDVARTFYPLAELKAIADLLAWHKLNILHLHLNDDEGWRIGVEDYPEVAEQCSKRGHGLAIPPLLGSSFEPYGSVYTPKDIKELEDHACSVSITLVPEIDVPGHAHALIQALPALREAGDTGGYGSIQGFCGNALNPCLPQTYDFLGAAFRTVAQHFKGPYIHIGGDEVGPDTWSCSPIAVRAAADKKLATTGELQDEIFAFVQRQVKEQSRKVVAWEDALGHSQLDPKTTVAVAWQHSDRAHERARSGYDVVLAPGNAYYLDMAATPDWQASGGHWAGVVPLHQTYDFEAELGWPKELLPKLRGVHACIWGEYMHDRRNFDALVFPRFFAFAERAWIDRTAKDYAGFLVRAEASTARIDRAGKNA